MRNTMSVRSATVGDATSMAALSDTLGYPVDPSTMAARLERLLGRTEDVVLVAQLADGQVIGWIHAAEHHLLEASERCEILGLVVNAGHRGQGIGRGLVEQVEAWARIRGLPQISVRSNIARSESHPFYERLGFDRAKTQHAYRKRLAK